MRREHEEPPPRDEAEANDQARRRNIGGPGMSNLFMIAEEDPVVDSSLKVEKKNTEQRMDSKMESKIYTIEGGSIVVKTASQQRVKKAIRAIGILLLVLIVFFMIIFGLTTEYRIIEISTFPVNYTTHPIYAFGLIFTSMFAIVGFGMIFMYFKKMTESALFTSIFIVSFSLLFSPLTQKFWYNVFIKGFNNSTNTQVGPDYFVNQSMGG